MKPKASHSILVTIEDEALIVALRRHTLLPLADCLYALQPTIPHLARSAPHRCCQRRGISRPPDIIGDKPGKKKFMVYPIGYSHIDIAEVRTKEGKLHLYVGIDRTSRFAFTQWHDKSDQPTAVALFEAMIETVFTTCTPSSRRTLS